MLFNSYIFIFAFLPITLIGYFALNHFKLNTIAKVWLVLCSLFFYAYYNPAYLWVIIASIVVNYLLCFWKVGQVKDCIKESTFGHRTMPEYRRAVLL